MQSERVYNFQRVFNLRMGKGSRQYDMPPYRAVGPVTRRSTSPARSATTSS